MTNAHDEPAHAHIPQGYMRCTRPVLFQTDLAEWKYATHGGTITIVQFEERIYGITCRHVFGDFSHSKLFVSPRMFPEKGDPPASLKHIWNVGMPTGDAIGSDISDLVVFDFQSDVTPAFFRDEAYIIKDKSVARSMPGDNLEAFGFLKSHTTIGQGTIAWANAQIDIRDTGIAGSDPALRRARAVWSPTKIQSLSGLSGSPVFNKTANALCGLVVRGGLTGSEVNIYYLDFVNIAEFIRSVFNGGGPTTITA